MIITKVIDLLCRQRSKLPELLSIKSEHHYAAEEETKNLIEQLAKLKYELQTNKPLKKILDNLSDANIYNEYLNNEQIMLNQSDVLWFEISWLYAECYLYRRMREIFFLSEHFKKFDQFYLVKEESFFSSVKHVSSLASHLLNLKDLAQKYTIAELFYFYTMVISNL